VNKNELKIKSYTTHHLGACHGYWLVFFTCTMLCIRLFFYNFIKKKYRNTMEIKVQCTTNKEFLKYWDCDILDDKFFLKKNIEMLTYWID
jgi:hypothetical protein